MRNITLWNEDLNPWRGLISMQRNLERIFDQEEVVSHFHPVCELEETDSHYLTSVDLPGVSKKDIQIEVKDRQVFISGERKSESKNKNISERSYGKFFRVISLPTDVDNENIEANYQDGVLTIALPKAESAKPRQIKIGDGKTSFFGKMLGSKETQKEEKASNTKVA